MNYKILHISPHLGGGVGKVLLNYLKNTKSNNEYSHNIFCLDFINDNAKNILDTEMIPYKEEISKNIKLLIDTIEFSDIVVIHWWNHPLLFELLVKYKLPSCRLIFWSHVSGKQVPQIFSHKLFDYANKFIFTTPISFLTHEAKTYENQEKLSSIWATAGIDYVENIERKEHKEFNIGYIGTLDFSKMYSNFIELCSKINIPNVKFIVCGEGCDKNKLIQQTKDLKIEDKFIFTGFVDDITPYLEIIDIFAYPLNQNHYGTCDQVLVEAMGVGIPCIVFENDMERYMIHNSYNGFVVKNEKEYVSSIEKLYQNNVYKRILEKNAKESTKQKYNIQYLEKEWNETFSNILNFPKTKKQWFGKFSGEKVQGFEIFLESIGNYSEIFETNNSTTIQNLLKEPNWSSNTKGTPKHYKRFFDDKTLEKWSN